MYIYMAQYCVFCCGSLLPVFGDVSPYIFHIILVRFELLSGHLLGKSCSPG